MPEVQGALENPQFNLLILWRETLRPGEETGSALSHTAQLWSDRALSSHSGLHTPHFQHSRLHWACTDMGNPICPLELCPRVPGELKVMTEGALASSRTGFKSLLNAKYRDTICLIHW